MQGWKIGLLAAPAVVGFSFGAKHIVQTSSENSTLDDTFAPPRATQTINVETSLNSAPQTLPHPKPQVQPLLRKPANKESQKVDLSKPLFQKLHDYTFKLMTPCSWGTGWILDYQIPKNKKYPTVWYIATAAHVVNNWQFEKKNVYQQELPTMCKPKWKTNFYFEIAKIDERLDPKPGVKLLKKEKIKNPRLFWTALNIFDSDSDLGIKNDHFKDFSVIEVTFESPEKAKEMTRGFADKYNVKSSDQLDIFGDGLDPETTKQDEQSRFYSFGYPMKKDEESFVKNNWSEGKRGDTLSNDPKNKYTIPNNKKVRGFVSASHFQGDNHAIQWGSKKYTEFGHLYYTNGVKLGEGASGSMVVDEKGKVLGVRALESDYSLYTPLRSKAIDKGEIKTPEYDLILGTDKQKSSYKKQVEEYLLKNKKQTWLSSLKKWTYPAIAKHS